MWSEGGRCDLGSILRTRSLAFLNQRAGRHGASACSGLVPPLRGNTLDCACIAAPKRGASTRHIYIYIYIIYIYRYMPRW